MKLLHKKVGDAHIVTCPEIPGLFVSSRSEMEAMDRARSAASRYNARTKLNDVLREIITGRVDKTGH